MGRKKKDPKQLVRIPLGAVAPKRGVSADDYAEEAVEALARSLAEKGLQEPVLVKEGSGKTPHRLMAGNLRYFAAKKLGWKEIEALLLDKSTGPAIRLIEKLQRNALDPWGSVDALVELKSRLGWTQAQLGQAIGRNRDYVANIFALTQITPEARAFIFAQKNGAGLSSRHLRYVGRASPSEQVEVAQRMLSRKLSTTTLERARRRASEGVSQFRFQNLRGVRGAGSANYPKTLKEWKRYRRQLATDLTRLERQETAESRRTRKQIAEVKQRLRLMKTEAARKKKELQRELRLARKQLGL